MTPAFAVNACIGTSHGVAGGGANKSVLVCHGVSCSANGGGARLLATLVALAPDSDIASTGCLGACSERANTLVDGKIVPSGDALRKAGIKPRPRSQRALMLKSAGDSALSGDAGNSMDPVRAARCYALALRALPTRGVGARARVGANYSAALLESGDPKAALAAARAALDAEPIDAAKLRVAQAYAVLGDGQGVEQVLATGGKDTKSKFHAWNRARQRAKWWSTLTGRKAARRSGVAK